MKSARFWPVNIGVFVGVSLANSSGCASSGQQRSLATVRSLQDPKTQIGDVHAQVDRDLASMHELQSTSDLPFSFSKFSADVDRTQAEADDNAAVLHAAGKKVTDEIDTVMSALPQNQSTTSL